MIINMDSFLKAIKYCTMKGKWGDKSGELSSQITCKVEDNNLYLLSANRANSVAVAYKLVLDNAEDVEFVLDLEVLPMLKTFSGEVEFEVDNVLTILQGSDSATVPLVAHHENESAIDRFSPKLINWIDEGFGPDFTFGSTKYDLTVNLDADSLAQSIKACDTVGASNYILNFHPNERLYLQASKGQRKISNELQMREHSGNAATVPFAAPIHVLFQSENEWNNRINLRLHDDMPLFASTDFAAIVVAPYMS
tara:strand:+ start:2079 stop:2834 length:756 start_codon:yes stop_codon:yes gene_type:complete